MDLLNGRIKPMYFKYLSAAFVVSVTRGLVISGILIMVLPALVSADAIWFAMPITELLVMIYAALAIRKYTNALPENPAYTSR